MINLFKMEFSRFFTNKMMYILLIVFIAFQIFGIFMIKQYEQPVPGEKLMSSMNESEFIQAMLSVTPSWVLIYITVFTVYFYMSEYNAGFYKNYITMKNARVYSVVSKIFILGLFTLSMFAALLISDLIGRAIFFNQAAIGDLGYFVKLLIGEILLHWAFSAVILCITVVIKSMIPSLVIGIVLVLNVPGIIAGVLESLFGEVQLSSYMLMSTILSIKDFNNVNDVIHVGSVAIVFLLLFSFISIRYKMREDLS